MRRKALVVFALALSLFGLMACGTNKDGETDGQEKETSVETEIEDQNEIVETVADEAETDEEVEAVEEATIPEWVEAYKGFLSEKENFKPALSELVPWGDSYLKGFALVDLTKDGIPELVVSSAHFDKWLIGTYVYTYSDGEVTLKDNFLCNETSGGLCKDEREDEYYLIMGGVDTLTHDEDLLYRYEDQETPVFHKDYDPEENVVILQEGDEDLYKDVMSHMMDISYCGLNEENIQSKICKDYVSDDFFTKKIYDYTPSEYTKHTAYRKDVEEYTDDMGSKYYIDWRNYIAFSEYSGVEILDIDPDNIEDWRLTYYVEMQKNYIDYINNSISYCFVYIDDDDIPECLVIVGLFGNDAGGVVLTICNNEVKSTKVCPYANHVKYKYKPKNNIFCTEYFGDYTESVDYYALKSGEFKILDELNRSDYEINIGNSGIYRYWKSYYDPENILSEAEYNEIINSYGEFVEISEDDFSSSIMDAKVLQ